MKSPGVGIFLGPDPVPESFRNFRKMGVTSSGPRNYMRLRSSLPMRSGYLRAIGIVAEVSGQVLVIPSLRFARRVGVKCHARERLRDLLHPR